MDVANFLGLKEINVALNVLLAVALVVVLVTLIETRIQLIGRIGKCAMSVRWSVGRLHGWSASIRFLIKDTLKLQCGIT